MTDEEESHKRSANAGSPQRRGDIQGLRAVAVVLVVIYHTGAALPGGFVGVDMFFVISGFVITRLLYREFETRGRLGLSAFYLRRIRRILPPLALMLTVVMLLSIALAPIGGQQITARTGIGAALLSANVYLIRFGGGGYFDIDSSLNVLLHTWSLSVEEQFYLVFPALLGIAWWLGRRLGRSRGRISLAVALLVVIAASLSVSSILSTGHAGPIPTFGRASEIAFYSPITRAWEFGIGASLVFVMLHLMIRSRVLATATALVGAALIFWSAFAFDGSTAFPGVAALVPVIGTSLLLAAGEHQAGNPVSALLSAPIAQRLGDLSYSWYLWHLPFIVLSAALWGRSKPIALAAAALSMGPALASFRWVENPIRFRSSPTRRRTLALAFACITGPVVAGLALEESHRLLQPGSELALHADVSQGCNSDTPLGARVEDACTWTVEPSLGLAVLVGDSNAGQFTEGFIEGAHRQSLDAQVATWAECPFVDLRLLANGEPREACSGFVVGTTAHLIADPPVVVVLASASDGYINQPEFALVDPGTGEVASDAAGKQRLWEAGLRRTIQSLEGAGIRVVVEHPIPKFPGWDPQACSALLWYLDGGSRCGTSESRLVLDARRANAVTAENAAVIGTDARIVDLFDILCPGTGCATLVNGVWRYRDGGHISIAESLALGGDFATALSFDPPIVRA